MTERDVVIDDHLLLRMLLDDEPAELRPSGGVVATTGLWYHRLCRALASPMISGAMSRSLGRVEPAVASAAVRAVTELPSSIAVAPLRDLAWPMAQMVATGTRVNLMSLEALAAAEHFGASICLSSTDNNPPLRDAAARRDIAVRLIPA